MSRSDALEKLWIVRTERNIFLTDKRHRLAIHFQDTMRLLLFAYLVDIFGHMNEINTSLQGPNRNIILSSQKICAFKAKLELWRMRLVEGRISSFSRLAKYLEDNKLSFGLANEGVFRHLYKLKK